MALGCADSADDVASEPAAAAPDQPGAAERVEPNQEQPAEKAAKPAARQQAYRSPFPRRVDLFSPMQRVRTTRSKDRDSGSAVVLKGFANLGESVAILAIDGRVTPLHAGDERFGVQVISIAPPNVVLQRGRSRWTATLH